MRLYVDLDGVLADFDSGYRKAFGVECALEKNAVDWKMVREYPNFYQLLDPMPDMPVLWEYVSRMKPTIITGIPHSVEEAPQNKRDWVKKHLGADVPVITCLSKDKSDYCKPGDVLIDDWEKYMDLWKAKQGIWVTHTSAKETIAKLRSLRITYW